MWNDLEFDCMYCSRCIGMALWRFSPHEALLLRVPLLAAPCIASQPWSFEHSVAGIASYMVLDKWQVVGGTESTRPSVVSTALIEETNASTVRARIYS